MGYRGMMDGWHGDENECQGHCEVCCDCEECYYERCDDEYEAWREEELIAWAS